MANDGDSSDEDEALGYGRPPARHRIKPGEIRNRWGRKGKPRPEVDFLEEPFKICIDDVWITVTRRLVLDHALFNSAMTKGRVSTVKELERRSRERATEDGASNAGEGVSADEEAALDRHLQRRLQQLQAIGEVVDGRKRGQK